jgi:integrase
LKFAIYPRRSHFYRHVWRPAMKKVKLELRIHDLRNAYASLLLAGGETGAAREPEAGPQLREADARHLRPSVEEDTV